MALTPRKESRLKVNMSVEVRSVLYTDVYSWHSLSLEVSCSGRCTVERVKATLGGRYISSQSLARW